MKVFNNFSVDVGREKPAIVGIEIAGKAGPGVSNVNIAHQLANGRVRVLKSTLEEIELLELKGL